MPRITPISSRSNPLLARLRRLLAQPDAYRRHHSFVIEGEHLCEAYLAGHSGAGVEALVGATAWDDPVLRRLASRAETVAVLPDALMAASSTLDTPAPLAFVAAWPGAGAILPTSPSVVLDRLQDAGNVGTILRIAAAFGFTQVVALKGTAALWSPKVLRAGMGAHFALNLVEMAGDVELDQLMLPMLATSPHAVEAIHRAALPWPCAWAMGHEGQGLSEGLTRRCSGTLRIPQPGGEESLNVAAAAAVCMYESARRRLTD